MVNKQPNFDVMSPKERRQYEAETGKKIPVAEMVTAEPKPQNVITTFGIGKTSKPKAAKGKKK